jgi:cytochrome c peroxidase
MRSDARIIARAVRTDPTYVTSYRRAFDRDPVDDIQIQGDVELALDAYMRRLVSFDAPFDRFIAGDDAAIDASAKRGFVVFLGKGMCAECHHGGMFTNASPHVTGVEDASEDKGYADTGAFFTPGLRYVAETAPYMHTGSVDRLADVIEFYRWGGDPGGYHGTKDPLMLPLEAWTAADSRDLEAFLHTLTGKPVADGLRRDTHSTAAPVEPPMCQSQEMQCGSGCCMVGHTCVAGMCVP